MSKGKRLERLIEESPYKNVSRFARHADVPYTTIKSFIERDLHKANVDNVFKVARALNVTVDDLIKDDVETISLNRERSELCGNSSKNDYTYFPTAISAGLPLSVDGITEASKISISDEVLGKYANDKDLYFSRANGDSMDKLFNDGSLLAIKPVTLDNLKNGDIVVFSDNHEYSVKHYHKYGDTLVFTPNSKNTAHKEQEYSTNDNITIHGKVVTYIVNLD